MKNTISITNFTCNGKCSNCGECCGDILPLSKKDIKEIDKYLKTHDIKPTPKKIFAILDNTCPFRDNEKKICKIYEVRPDICKYFKCDRTPKEAIRFRNLYNEERLSRSMREVFFNDKTNALDVSKTVCMPIFDRNGKKIIEG